MLNSEALLKTLNLPDRIQKGVIKRRHNKAARADKNTKTQWWTKRFFDNNRRTLIAYLDANNVAIDKVPHYSSATLTGQHPRFKNWQRIWKVATPYMLPNRKADEWQDYGFENLCAPALAYVQHRLKNVIERCNKSGLNADPTQLRHDVDAYLRKRLASLITPTLVLEANINRLKKSGVPGTSEQRFQAFLRQLGAPPDRNQFWTKYPVLWRLVSTVTENTINACTETMQRVARDRQQLEHVFYIKRDDKLRRITWGTGDPHCGGRTGCLLHFHNGNLVYKPKDMRADKAFNDFVTWYSSVTTGTPLPSCTVLPRGAYGYRQYIPATHCQAPEEVQEFYTKLGALIAVSWVLGLTDLHHENMIASGSQPFLIDVEAMFNRPVRYDHKNTPSYQDCYGQAFQDSLLGTGLLPFRVLGPNGVYDVSAIGARGEQAAPGKAIVIDNAGRDDLQLTPTELPLLQEVNVPILDGVAAKSSDYAEEIVRGYMQAATVLDNQKPSLLGRKSVLRKVGKAPVRYVARATMDYAQLLQKMMHPTVLQDGLECDFLIAGELRASLAIAPHVAPLLAAEAADLWNGDVPYFYTYPDSTDLYSSTGEKLPRYFEKSGLAAHAERLNALGSLRDRHIATIRGAIKSTMPLERQQNDPFKSSASTQASSNPPSKMVKAAEEIGFELLQSAFYVNNTPFWIGFTALKDSDYNVGLMPVTLYDGAPGIGIFLAYLNQWAKNDKFDRIARDAHELVKKSLRATLKEKAGTCGAFNGLSGLIYADIHIAAALGVPAITPKLPLFRHLKAHIKKDELFDVISGAAGALLIALKYHQQYGDRDALEAAAIAAEHLATTAEAQNVGVAWRTLKDEEKCVGGLSHGVSGIAWALAEWAVYTKGKKWRQLAAQAFAYEQSLFDKKTGLWKDARDREPTCFWCYGAPGIGMAAAHMSRVLVITHPT